MAPAIPEYQRLCPISQWSRLARQRNQQVRRSDPAGPNQVSASQPERQVHRRYAGRTHPVVYQFGRIKLALLFVEDIEDQIKGTEKCVPFFVQKAYLRYALINQSLVPNPRL